MINITNVMIILGICMFLVNVVFLLGTKIILTNLTRKQMNQTINNLKKSILTLKRIKISVFILTIIFWIYILIQIVLIFWGWDSRDNDEKIQTLSLIFFLCSVGFAGLVAYHFFYKLYEITEKRRGL